MSMPLGVYVHFPWCLKKCPYCDFVSYAEERDRIDHGGYADAVLGELQVRASSLEGRRVESVFFGGGTPSLWRPEELGRVLAAILAEARARGEVADDVEITVECNPTSLDEDRARALRAAGVNRLSVGVQGLDRERLRFLGRLHEPEGGMEALRAAIRSGMPRVSGDLIYGVGGDRKPSDARLASAPAARLASAPAARLASAPAARLESAPPEQTAGEAADEAARVAATGVSHVSAYSLTIEPGTRFGALARRGRLPIAAEDAVAESFAAIEATLEGAGLMHYEISNYARPGEEARHNLGYWRGRDYLGLGCAAFGALSEGDGSATRYRNAPQPEKYMAGARHGSPPTDSEERLDPETRLRERIMLGLRIREGFDLEGSAQELGVRAWPDARKRAADRLLKQGKLEIEGGRLKLPRAAWLFADGIAAELF